MYIELRHLRTIRAVQQAGGLARAAEVLNMTQSALSHQVAGLEDQVGMELFVRRSKPMRLSSAGQRLLRLADLVLPEVDATIEEFRALRAGKAGRLFITTECQACFDWLFPVLEQFRHAWPDVEVDIRTSLSAEALPALMREDVDLAITSTPVTQPGMSFHPLFDYLPRLVCAAANPLAEAPHVTPQDLADQVLITYAGGRDRIDAFTEFLSPARIEPRQHRTAELTAVILMLVASNRGVAILPDWALRGVGENPDYAIRPLQGDPAKRMYAATREDDALRPYMAHFLRLARQEAVKLQRG